MSHPFHAAIFGSTKHHHATPPPHLPPPQEQRIPTNPDSLRNDEHKRLHDCYQCMFEESGKGSVAKLNTPAFQTRYKDWNEMATKANKNTHGLTPEKWIQERFNRYEKFDKCKIQCHPIASKDEI